MNNKKQCHMYQKQRNIVIITKRQLENILTLLVESVSINQKRKFLILS